MTCGTGSKSRSRNCDAPQPEHGGQMCEGESSDNHTCQLNICAGKYMY